MRAYVSIRGSRSPRAVKRDASPLPSTRGSDPYPYARLVFAHPDGTATSFELTYSTLGSGIKVFLNKKHSTEEGRDVFETEV